jgi:tetratricopeptide (TPR) repeat protein
LNAAQPLNLKPSENLVSAIGNLNSIWGGILLRLGRYEEAIVRADSGLNRLEPYLKVEPNDTIARQLCLNLHGNRAYALVGLQKHAEAAAEWTRVVELAAVPVPEDYRVRLAIELAQTGDLARALAQVDLVKGSKETSGNDCYNLGCLYALCAAAVQKDTRRPLAQRSTLVESHIKSATRWLNSARDAGLFKKPGRSSKLRRTPTSRSCGTAPSSARSSNRPKPNAKPTSGPYPRSLDRVGRTSSERSHSIE